MAVIISQSLIKGYQDYVHDKMCGIFFEAKYINKDPRAFEPPTDSMQAGIYFEYLCTGALPKSQEIPEPEYVYKGTARQKLSAQYERIEQSVDIFKNIIKHYKINIKEIGKYIEVDGISGVIDIYAEWDGKDVFIDLKYSGLIDDRWSDIGWDLDSLHTKDNLMIQGVHYKLLAQKTGISEDIPFFYFVFSTQDPYNVKIIQQYVDEYRLELHESQINNLRLKLNQDIDNGFVAKPTLSRCHNCPISDNCSHKIDIPFINSIYY